MNPKLRKLLIALEQVDDLSWTTPRKQEIISLYNKEASDLIKSGSMWHWVVEGRLIPLGSICKTKPRRFKPHKEGFIDGTDYLEWDSEMMWAVRGSKRNPSWVTLESAILRFKEIGVRKAFMVDSITYQNMLATELTNIIEPSHEGFSCTDHGTENGFYSRNGQTWHGCCRRCMLLEIIRDGVPDGFTSEALKFH